MASAAPVMFSAVVLGVCQYFFCLRLLPLSFCNTEWLPDSDTQQTFPVQDFYSFCSLFKDGIISSGTAVAQWLRCCATNGKVVGSIPDGVIEIFHCYNPSDRTMVLGSTQPLTEMSTRSISWGKGGRCVRLTALPPSCVVMKSGNLNFLGPSG